MASYNYTFTSGDTVTPTKLNSARTVSEIVNADIKSDAAIALSKLATGALPAAITVASDNLVDGTIVNADINASAAIAGTKVAPNFGSQNVLTTGAGTFSAINASGTFPVLQLTETDATNNNQRWDINAENEVMAIRAVNDAYTNAGNAIEIQRTGTTIDSVSMPNGNVNIGTNSSTSKLTVVDNSANDAVRITQTGSGNALVVEDSANPDATPFVVRADGNVGIGASSANAKLQFDNAVATNGYDANKIRLYDDGTTVYGLGIAPAELGYRAEQHVFYSDATTPAERLRIGSSGNVGINTTTPTERLDVNGTVKATAFSGPLTGNVTGNVTGTASAIADGSVSTAKIVDANVTDAKLAATLNLSSKTVTLPATIALPAGAVMAFAMNSAPAGWLAADGSNVNRTTYAALFSAISTTYGAGDGSTTFALPDLRGIFVRGSGSQTISGITYNKTFAAKEGDAFQGHEHTAPNGESLAYSSSGRAAGAANTWYGDTGTGDNIIGTDGTNGTPRTASETRPANIALLYCIKF